MKIIYSSFDPFAVTQLKDILEREGVPCVIRNEISAALAGEIPMSECIPELWIQNDRDLDQALRIKVDWRSPAEGVGGAWKCPTCGESLEGQFTSCWKCGVAKD